MNDGTEGDPKPDEGLRNQFEQLVIRAGGPTRAARSLAVSRTTLDQWAKGRARIPLEPTLRLAKLTGTSLDQLFAAEVSPDLRAPAGDQPVAKIPRSAPAMVDGPVPLPPGGLEEVRQRARMYGIAGIKPPDVSFPDGFVSVSVLKVTASAGRGRFTTPDDLTGGDMVAFREVWLRSLGLTPGRTHILWAVGDSMNPTINDGDMLLVDRMIDQVLDDGIYVVVVGGGVVVKRIQLRHNGSVVLKSDNSRYDEQTIPADEVPSLIVEGRVRWVGGPI